MSLSTKLRTLAFYAKPRKVVALYKLFLGDEWLETSVDSIAQHVYRIVFVVSDVAWGGDRSIEADEIEDVVRRIGEKYGERVTVLRGSFSDQLAQVSFGLEYIRRTLKETTHILYIDSDEVYLDSQIRNLLRLTRSPRYFNRAIRIQYNMYFKTIFHRIEPKKWPTALALFPLRPYVEFVNERNVSCNTVERPDLSYEHYAYVRKSDERLRKKLLAHRNSIEPIRPGWFDDVWLAWTPEMTNLHPVHPEWWERSTRLSEVDVPAVVKTAVAGWATDDRR